MSAHIYNVRLAVFFFGERALIKLSVTMWFVYPCSSIELLLNQITDAGWHNVRYVSNAIWMMMNWWTLRTFFPLCYWYDQFYQQQKQQKLVFANRTKIQILIQ